MERRVRQAPETLLKVSSLGTEDGIEFVARGRAGPTVGWSVAYQRILSLTFYLPTKRACVDPSLRPPSCRMVASELAGG